MIEIPRIVERQSRKGVCAYIDLRNTFDTEQARAQGVDLEDLLVSQPESLEQALEIADTLLRTGAISLLVIDLGDGPVHFQRIRGLLDTAHRTDTSTVIAATILA